MRYTIKKSCQWARRIISVSKNTKKDLMKLYAVPEEKIEVIYEGCENDLQVAYNTKIAKPYLLFIGRLEERKNIVNIINAFEILKEQYKIPHKLVLAGKPGFGYEKIEDKIANSNYRQDIVASGFVSGQEKAGLLKNAAVFVFPTLYEGFGLPILEAQNIGVPVVASIESSIPEVAGDGALLVDPNNAEAIADAVYKLISDEKLKNDIIEKGKYNAARFSWDKCAKETSRIL
jgi:glycosyltransferase involved in cell wall biosynthesis